MSPLRLLGMEQPSIYLNRAARFVPRCSAMFIPAEASKNQQDNPNREGQERKP